MSNELPPPTLRLKPRSRPEGDAAVPPNSQFPDAPSPPPASTDSFAEAPKLRLRPKLDLTEPGVAVPVEPEPAAAVPVAPPIALKPRLKLDLAEAPSAVEPGSDSSLAPTISESGPVAAVEPLKFKLKQKTAEPAEPSPANELGAPIAPVGAALPPPVPKSAVTAVDPSTLPPPFPVVANASAPKNAKSFPPPTPRLAVKRPVELDDTANPSAGSGKSKKLLLVGLLGLAVAAAGYVGYQKFVSAAAIPISAPAVATKPAVTEEPAPRPSTPSATLNELSALPARAIRKAEDVVASARANEQNRVDELQGDESIPLPTIPSRKASPTPKAVVPTTATTQLAPGVTATSIASDVSGDASVAFRSWVAQARVSGVFQGNPARALINGRTVSAGQIVDDLLAITFEGVDPTAKTLVFVDGTGAKVVRKF